MSKEIEENYVTELPPEYEYIWLIVIILIVVSIIMLGIVIHVFKLNFRMQIQDQINSTIRGSIGDYQKIHDMSSRNTDSDLKPGEVELN